MWFTPTTNSILLAVSHPPGMPPFHLVRWMLSYSVLYGCFAAGHQGRVRGRAQKSVSATHLKEHGSLGSPSLVQAWRQECRRDFSCHEHPAVPRKAYLINIPIEQESAKREFSIKQLEALGFEVEVVNGINTTHYAGPEDQYTRCLPAGEAMDCQLGLTLTHVEIWRRIVTKQEAAAWVFEDDMVLHESILNLFPEYWRQVPKSFDYVAVGQIPRAFGVSQKLVTAGPEHTPWGTHAYIISAQLAERMALLAQLMVERSRMPAPSMTVAGQPYWYHTTSWVLDGEDMKIDHFISLVYDSLTPQSEKSRWLVFESTAEVPFVFHGVEWSRHGGCECGCGTPEMVTDCIHNGRAPAYGTGLAAQHRCARNVHFVQQWLEGISEGVFNGSVQLCSERTSCGAYLCDGEKPKESNQTVLISPVSAYINAELHRDPGFLSNAIGVPHTQEVNMSDSAEVHQREEPLEPTPAASSARVEEASLQGKDKEKDMTAANASKAIKVPDAGTSVEDMPRSNIVSGGDAISSQVSSISQAENLVGDGPVALTKEMNSSIHVEGRTQGQAESHH
eukprot:jgi/Botrbrau1/19251/Bobra.0073s0004.1